MRNKRTTEPALELLTVIIGITALVLVVMFFSSCAGSGKGGGTPPSPRGEPTAPAQPQPPPVPTPDPKHETPTKTPAHEFAFVNLISFPEPSKETAINVRHRGVLPGNTPEQNSDAIEAIFNSIPEGNAESVYIPAGDYYFARAAVIYRRPIYLFGDNGTIFGNSTRLHFPPASHGIMVDRGGISIQETIIERLCVISSEAVTGQGDGILLLARAKVRDCTAKGFGHYGFSIWANMEEGRDASGSLVQSCHSLENKLDGFFAGRVDANAILFLNCDARDNGRYGFNDDSFLGNNFISCMAHYNKAGDYYVRDKGNARSFFDGCYSEGGNVPSQLGPHSTVRGGMWGSGFTQ